MFIKDDAVVKIPNKACSNTEVKIDCQRNSKNPIRKKT